MTRVKLNFCNCFNLTQLVEEPTRITEHSRTLIDVILTTTENNVKQTVTIPSSISDHDIVMSTLALKKCRSKPTYVSVRSFRNYDKDAFCKDISNAPWSIIENLKDVNESLNGFDSLFNEILDQHAPIKKVKVPVRPNPFVTEEIRVLMRCRDRWRKFSRKSGDSIAWSNYRNCKREVKYRFLCPENEFTCCHFQKPAVFLQFTIKILIFLLKFYPENSCYLE